MNSFFTKTSKIWNYLAKSLALKKPTSFHSAICNTYNDKIFVYLKLIILNITLLLRIIVFRTDMTA